MKKYFTKLQSAYILQDLKKSKDLVRTLGWFQLIMLGIGAIIGAGVFVYTGTAAAQHAGPALSISFILAGFACACAAFCYAEMSAALPTSGSVYTYAYVSLGEWPAWMVCGMSGMAYCTVAAGVAAGWTSYVGSLLADLGIHIPAYLTSYYGAPLADGTTGLCNLPATLLVILLGYIVLLGAETSAIVNTIIVFIKFSVLLGFIIVGLAHVDPQNWVPFIPENTGEYGKFGWSGIASAASIILLAYNGFDMVATAAQETKHPKRDLPIGIIGSLVISMIIYILVSLTMTGLVPYANLDAPEPIAIAVDVLGMPIFSTLIKIGAIAGLTTVVLVVIFSLVRVFYSITHDGLLPKGLAVTHKKHKTPHVLTFLISATIIVLSNVLPADSLAGIGSVGAMVQFVIACMSVIRLRSVAPELNRPFHCPLVPFIPMLGILLFGTMIFSATNEVLLYTLFYIIVWGSLYFVYGARNGLLSENNIRAKKVDA